MPKIDEFKELFKCKYCLDMMEDPVMLPCGESICKKHSDEVCLETCRFCDQKHLVLDDGFASNKVLKKMIDLEVNKLTFQSVNYNCCRKDVDEINAIIAQIDLIKRDPRNFIYEHFSNYRNMVDLRKERLTVSLETWYAEEIASIKLAESECEKGLVDLVWDECGLEDKNKAKESFQKLVKRFETFELDDAKYKSIHDESGALKERFEVFLDGYRSHLLDSRTYLFEYKPTFSKEMFGIFSRSYKLGEFFPSTILCNDQMKSSFLALCGFSQEQQLKCVYRASEHGFENNDFHSRCDSVEKTITIIRTVNNCIFGGYTDKAWSSVGGFVRDGNAFIFSLVNRSQKPIKIKCSDPEHAIYCGPGCGPTFGSAHSNLGNDIRIKSGSNNPDNLVKGKCTYSSLGSSYIHPSFPGGCRTVESQLFLAGAKNFQTKDIEVYRVM